MALVLLLSFENGEDLGVGEGESADEDGLVEFLGDRDLLGLRDEVDRKEIEPRPSNLFGFLHLTLAWVRLEIDLSVTCAVKWGSN